MRACCLFFLTLCVGHLAAQVYQGLFIPDNLGRFGTGSPITQASGLALDDNGISLWTHNDQGDPSTDIYRILTSSGNQMITIEKTIEVLNTENLDWEDMARDDTSLYLCQVGKNCNANSDPDECPSRFIFKIHKLPFSTLNHPDSTSVTPETYYFKYPLTGYDVEHCMEDDTVFVNCEAVIYFEEALYLFTKNIWSKNTNNCGGWQNGYTYCFKLPLIGGSSMEDPIVAVYHGKYNLKVLQGDTGAKYQVTGAAISPDNQILVLLTYGRIWQFKNFIEDAFFTGTAVYSEFSSTGSDTITRGYEGIEFVDGHRLTLCVDGSNGRLSGADTDSIALWVRNTNDDGPGSLRRCLASASDGDTIRVVPSVAADTIVLDSAVIPAHSLTLLGDAFQPLVVRSSATPMFQINPATEVRLRHLHGISLNPSGPVILNGGELLLEDIHLSALYGATALLNTGAAHVTGTCIVDHP